mgnify:CR=1 FL=1
MVCSFLFCLSLAVVCLSLVDLLRFYFLFCFPACRFCLVSSLSFRSSFLCWVPLLLSASFLCLFVSFFLRLFVGFVLLLCPPCSLAFFPFSSCLLLSLLPVFLFWTVCFLSFCWTFGLASTWLSQLQSGPDVWNNFEPIRNLLCSPFFTLIACCAA